MISNNDKVDVMQIKNYMNEPRLFHNVLHSAYVNEYTTRLIHIFGMRYGALQSKNMPFEVNLFDGGLT